MALAKHGCHLRAYQGNDVRMYKLEKKLTKSNDRKKILANHSRTPIQPSYNNRETAKTKQKQQQSLTQTTRTNVSAMPTISITAASLTGPPAMKATTIRATETATKT